MNIVWKSGVSEGQLKDRVEKGAKKLELHLEEKDLDDLDGLLERLEKYNEKIEIVHTPIQERYTIEGLHSKENKRVIEKTFKLAQMVSKGTRMIDVVLHQTLSLDRLRIWGMYGAIKESIQENLERNPNIVINLENLTIMGQNSADKTEEGMRKVTRDSYFLEPLKVCKALREDIKTERVGLVWDICHGVSSKRLMQHLIDINYLPDMDLEDYIKNYIPYLNIIHLSNTRGYGTEEGHGAPFDNEGEEKELREIIELLKKYKYTNKVTLEVWEHDYTNIKNCVYMEEQIKEILYKKETNKRKVLTKGKRCNILDSKRGFRYDNRETEKL